MEKSGKWGEDLDVILKFKTAFLIEIGKLLKIEKAWFSFSFESKLCVIVVSITFVNYYFKNSIIFIIEIVHEKEISLLINREKTTLLNNSFITKQNKLITLKIHKKLIHKPIISQQLYG